MLESRFPSIKNLYDTISRNSIHRKTSRCTGIKNTNKVYAHTRLIYAQLPQFRLNKVNLKLYILTDLGTKSFIYFNHSFHHAYNCTLNRLLTFFEEISSSLYVKTSTQILTQGYFYYYYPRTNAKSS